MRRRHRELQVGRRGLGQQATARVPCSSTMQLGEFTNTQQRQHEAGAVDDVPAQAPRSEADGHDGKSPDVAAGAQATGGPLEGTRPRDSIAGNPAASSTRNRKRSGRRRSAGRTAPLTRQHGRCGCSAAGNANESRDAEREEPVTRPPRVEGGRRPASRQPVRALEGRR